MTVKFVAEIGSTHAGKLENCLKLIQAAKSLKVDRIKFQCFNPILLAKKRAAGHLGERYSEARLKEVYSQTYIHSQWWPTIKRELDDYPWSCSVFSEADLEFMEYFRCPSYKIASFELTDLVLIEAVARKKKPMVMSVNETHSLVNVENAWRAATKHTEDVTFLYATPYDPFDLVDQYGQVVWLSNNAPAVCHLGLSDHSPAGDSRIAKMCEESWLINMVERHLCLSGVLSADAAFSDTPEQFAALMKALLPAMLQHPRVENAD